MSGLIRFLFSVAIWILIVPVGEARADLFNFNFAGSGQSASGTLVANATGTANQYLITSISGTLTGVSIAGLIAPGGFGGNDNLLTNNGTSLIPDSAGFSFQLSNGVNANVFTFVGPPFNNLQFLVRSDGALAAMTTFSITPAAVPEPSSFLLLGTGLAGLARVARAHVRAQMSSSC